MSIDLVPFPAGEVEQLEAWIAAPHVARWWKPGWGTAAMAAVRGAARESDGSRPWRIDLDGRQIGYAEDRSVAGPWMQVEGVGPGTREVRLLIGDADAVNRKHGREAIRAIARAVFADPGVDRLVAAPHPDNWAAVIAFKKAGFRERGRRQFPDGAVMVLTLAKSVWSG